jgi:hypothetical protein
MIFDPKIIPRSEDNLYRGARDSRIESSKLNGASYLNSRARPWAVFYKDIVSEEEHD